MSAIVYRGQDFTVEEAEAITSDIRAWAGTLWQKLKTAHDGKAWKALGYTSWAAYVGAEFDISRSYAYRLISHANVVLELAEAAGLDPEVSPMGDTFTERDTRAIDTTAVASDVAERVQAEPDADEHRRAQIVSETVEEHKRTETTTTTVDADTGEVLDPVRPTDAPDATASSEPVGDSRTGGPAPSGPAPIADPAHPTMSELADWHPEHGQWCTYEEMRRDDATRQFARLMDRRLPRDDDADLAGCCPPEALRSALFAAEVAAGFWADLVDDLKARMHPSNTDGRHLAAVEG